MSNIIRVKKNANFSVMSNEPFNDPSLSWKAKGLLAYLLTRPDNWQINVEHLRKASTNGRDAIYGILKELMEARYIVRNQSRNRLGRTIGFEYLISEVKIPLPENPETDAELPFTENPETENPHINKDLLLINTEDSKAQAPCIRDRKIEFIKEVLDWCRKNPNKYPKLLYVAFCKHWLEESRGGKKLRHEGEKFFNMGKRLNTWFGNTKDNMLSDLWMKEAQLPGLNILLRELIN